jgi:hypothetical protein
MREAERGTVLKTDKHGWIEVTEETEVRVAGDVLIEAILAGRLGSVFGHAGDFTWDATHPQRVVRYRFARPILEQFAAEQRTVKTDERGVPLIHRDPNWGVSVLAQAQQAQTQAEPEPLDKVPGYETLDAVLRDAYDQAARGKGAERHADNKPFDAQPMQLIADRRGIGFILGQADKKSEEAQGMLNRGRVDAAIRELLGAIVYTAGAIIWIERHREELEEIL